MGLKDPLEKGMATHSGLENSMDREAWGTKGGRTQQESDTTEQLAHTHTFSS